MHRRCRPRHQRAAVADDLARKVMGGRGSFGRRLVRHARGEVGGVEAVARGGQVDRHHDLRHRDELALAAGGDQRAVRSIFSPISDAKSLQPLDGRFRARISHSTASSS